MPQFPTKADDTTRAGGGFVSPFTASLMPNADQGAWQLALGIVPTDPELAALAALTSATDKVPYYTGSGTAALSDLTPVARTLLAQTTQALMRSTGLGLGDLSTANAAAVPALTMAGNIALGSNYVSGDGGNEGIKVNSIGTVSIITNAAATESLRIERAGGTNRLLSFFENTGNGPTLQIGLNWSDYSQIELYDIFATANQNMFRIYSDGGVFSLGAMFSTNSETNRILTAKHTTGNVGIGATTWSGDPPSKLSALGDIASYNATPAPTTSNYERLRSYWSSNIAIISTEALGTGTLRGLKIGSAATSLLGFWGATPVVQQVLATGGGATVDNVITLLQTLGLCKQS